MGAEIDRLEVQVEAQAAKANAQLDKLIGKLNNVASALTGVNNNGFAVIANGVQEFAKAAGGLANVKTADFTRLVKNIGQLTAINAQQLNGTSSAITAVSGAISSMGSVSGSSVQVADMAKNISKLGGVNVQRAVANLPQLEKAMTSFLTSMSQAPMVSRNVIQMTNALAELAANGGKAGAAASTVSSALNRQAGSAERAAASTRSLSSVIGSLYQKYFWLSRGAKSVWGSAESSMDFMETVNYFEVAMRKIGESAALGWKENGYSSAESYAESFSVRLKQLTAKMTGFQVDTNGNAVYTGDSNLGMNPDEVMQWQAVYAQMTDSLGLAEESTLRFSRALTMLGADWASLRNISFDTAWNKFASAIAGQSRAVRSLGIDITQATLQEYAYKYGLTEAVAEMNQATKAQLRLLAIMDQSRVAYGDLANTISSPSNQLRMLEQNFANLGRTVGNLFIPVIEKALPYVNGLTIALQRLFSWAGSLMGIKLDSINSSMGGMSDEMADLVGGAEDYENALNGAGSAAKKLKNNLQSWHEINNISTQDSSASSAGGSMGSSSPLLDDAIMDSLAEYEKAWNKAFENMENRAQEYADKIEKFLGPAKEIINDFVIGDYFQAGKDTSKLVAGIFNFFADAIDDVDWYRIGQNIGDYLAGIDWLKILGSIGRLLWETLKASFELYAGAFSAAPIETALISLVAMPKALKAITASKFITGIKKLTSNFKLVNSALTGNKESIAILAEQYPGLSKVVDVARTAFDNFRSGLQNGNFFTGLNSGIATVRNNLTAMQKGVIGAAAVFGEFVLVKDAFYDLASGSDNVVASLLKIVGGAGAASAALYVAFGPAGLVVAAITGVAAAFGGINKAFDEIRAEEIGNIIKNAMTNPGGVPLGEITSRFATAFSDAASGFTAIAEKSAELDSVQKNVNDTWTEIYKIQEAMENGVLSVEEGNQQLGTLFSELATLTEQKFSGINTVIMSAYGENGSFKTALEQMGVDTEAAIDTMVTYGYQCSKRAKEIAQELAGMDVDSEEYKKLIAELSSLTKEMSQFASATSNFTYDMNSLQGKINYDDIFMPDGSINTELLKEYFNEASSALEDYKDSLDVAGKEISKQWQEVLNSTTATEAQKAEARINLEAIPKGIEYMKTEAELKIVAFTDMLQNDFVKETGNVISDAQKEWNAKTDWDKFWSGVFGPGTEGEYVKEAVEQQQANIDTLSLALEESFGGLKQEGVVWASDAATEIYGALFDTEYHFSEMGSGKTKYALNEHFREIINGATDGIADLTADRGKDAVDGYADSFSANANIAEKSVKSFIDKVLEAVAVAQDSHSPSREYAKLGGYAVEGYAKGITDNTFLAETAIFDWMQKTEDAIIQSEMKFGGNSSVAMRTYGRDTVTGYNTGISDNINSTVTAISQWMTRTKVAIQNSAMKLSSTSQTTYQFGLNTVKGYNNGVSASVNTTTNTMAQWMARTQAAIQNSTMRFSGISQTAYQFGLGTVRGYNSGVTNNSYQTINTMQSYMNNVENRFRGIVGIMNGLGVQAMWGFANGIESMRGVIEQRAQSIADSVTRTIQSALDIHSPSRVMFSLGEYTMEGYQLGVESMYANLERSFGRYEMNTLDMLKSDLGYDTAGLTLRKENAVNNQYFADLDTRPDMSETNMLLREVLSALKDGKEIIVDGRVLGKTLQKQNREHFNATGRGLLYI